MSWNKVLLSRLLQLHTYFYLCTPILPYVYVKWRRPYKWIFITHFKSFASPYCFFSANLKSHNNSMISSQKKPRKEKPFCSQRILLQESKILQRNSKMSFYINQNWKDIHTKVEFVSYSELAWKTLELCRPLSNLLCNKKRKELWKVNILDFYRDKIIKTPLSPESSWLCSV